MKTKLSEIINLKTFKNSKLLTNPEVIQSIKVTGISVIEAPIENFVHEDEIVLSTCIGYSDTPELLIEFISEIHSLGASCLMLALESNSVVTNRKVIEFADSLSFPLILLPWKLRFAEVIKEVVLHLGTHISEFNKFINLFKDKLLYLFYDKKSIDDVVQLIEKQFYGHVIMFDVFKNIKSMSPNSQNVLNALRFDELIANSKSSTSNVLILNLNSYSHKYGYLALDYSKTLEKVGFDLSDENNVLLLNNMLCEVIPLWINLERSIFESQYNQHQRFLKSLLLRKGPLDNQIIEEAEKIGFETNKTFSSLVIILDNIDNTNDNLLNNIAKDVLRFFTSQGILPYILIKKTHLILFIDDEIFKHLSLDDLFKSVRNIILSHNEDLVLFWGTGRSDDSFNQFNSAYQAALTSALSQQFINDEENDGFITISLLKMIETMNQSDDIIKIVNTCLNNIIEYDLKTGIDLLSTFKEYMNSNQNISEASRNSHMHRQTLIYRLNKIEELSSFSINNSTHCFFLLLCIKIYESWN